MLDFSHAFYENMNVSLLASQPVTKNNQDDVGDKDWGILYSQLEAGLSSDRMWRYSWWAYWNRVAEFILPRRHHFLIVANRMTKGNPINDQIIDSTGTLSMQTCAAGLFTGTSDPSKKWMKIGLATPGVEEDEAIQRWLEDAEEKIYTVLAQSNFYTIMPQACQDIVTFGTSPIIVYEDYEDVVRFYLPCAGEYFLRCSARMDIDTFTREFVLTVSQIVDQFGVENCPQAVLQLWNEGGGALTTEFIVAHTIAPNFAVARRDATDGSFFSVPKKFKYKEIYWLRGVKTPKPLSIRGFDTKPFAVGRWSTVSNDPYGRSPGMDGLGDIKQLQRMTLRAAEFIEKLARPPMGAEPELKNQPASIQPGAITYLDTTGGKKGFWPLYQIAPAALAPLTQMIATVEARIEKVFFVPIFMAITQMAGVQPRNELELTKRDLERLQALGPIIELYQQEFLGPIVQRVLEILEKKRLLQPRPPSMHSIPLKISYISMMKIAQNSMMSVSMKDVFSTMGALSSAAKAAGVPDPLRVINLDKSARKYGDINNYPSDCMYTDDEVQKHDEERNKAMQQEKMQAQAPQLAMASVNAAKTLSQTPVPGGSALNSILGQGGA